MKKNKINQCHECNEQVLTGKLNTEMPQEIENPEILLESNVPDGSLENFLQTLENFRNLHEFDLQSNLGLELPARVEDLTDPKDSNTANNYQTRVSLDVRNFINSQKLNLSKKHLTELPPEIGQPENLQSLDLSSNQLTDVPPEIGNLKNLKMLNISFNNISKLPPEIGNLTNLIEIHIFGDQRIVLPPEIGQLINLREINFSYRNMPREFPSEIYNIPELSITDWHD
ncbi:MAG: leucine-rich repeat domain-containing protein [Nitrospirae bacterium]|nr:leucine-rich repeat domain-containing protein [Nitrospirota bacterium]